MALAVAAASTEGRLGSAQPAPGCAHSKQHRASGDHVDAEEALRTVLDRLSCAGARVLPERHLPHSLGRVGNLVINDQGIHIVEGLTVTHRSRLWVDCDGVPRVGPVALTHVLNHLSDVATFLAAATYTIMDCASPLPIYKLVAAVGGPTGQGFNCYDTDLVSIDLVPLWVSRLTGERDPIDVVTVTAALEQICPDTSWRTRPTAPSPGR
jgi:hypothetical protein